MNKLDNYSNGNERKRYVSERSGFNGYNMLIALVSLFLIVIGIALTSVIFSFNALEILVMSIILAVFYCIILFFLALRKTVKEVKTFEVKNVAPTVKQAVEQPMFNDFTPIVKEVVVEKPVVKTVYRDRIIRPKPVVKTVYKTKIVRPKPVVKTVYRTRIVRPKVKKLNIPHYNFIGSTQTRTYHTRNCRLGKLVKKKYKLMDNSPNFFKKRKFKSCKMCIQKIRKS
ncbi:MAG: hypothetical protein WCK90_01935 [archaeon]